MDLRPKTKRRLSILLIGGTLLGSIAGMLVIIGLHHHEAHRQAFRALAMAAYERGDYRTATDNFSRYLGNDQMDSQAIFYDAVARSKLPQPDMSNLVESSRLFSRYLELQDGDVEAQHRLLAIYQLLHYTSETSQLAGQLLAKNPDDIPGLTARIADLVRSGHYDQALPICMHLNDLQPFDVPTQQTTYELMGRLKKPPQQLIDRAQQMLAAHPADPRFELLRAVAAFTINDQDGTRKWLRLAATRSMPDANFTLLLAGAFDRLTMWDDAWALLEKNAELPTASPALKSEFVQRLWEMGQYDRARSIIGDLHPADPATDANLLGLNELILFTINSSGPARLPAEFQSVLAAMEKRSDDPAAAGWTQLLQSLVSKPSESRLETVRLCQSAMRLMPQNAIIQYYLGRDYLLLAESELARQALEKSAQLRPEWAAPYVLMSRILSQRGDISESFLCAKAAYDRDAKSFSTQLTFALASYHHVGIHASAGEIAPVLKIVQQLRQSDAADPQLLTAEIDLLARSNHLQDAIDRCVAAVAMPAKPSPSLLATLARLDRSDHLGISALLVDRLSETVPTTPQAAVEQVQADVVVGDIPAAKVIVQVIATHPTPGWMLAGLQCREAIGDQGVASDWEKFADAFPSDLEIQQAGLHSAALVSNRALMDRTIDRVKNLTGDDAIQWKLARAEWHLFATEDVKTNANSAAASMAEIVRIAPHYAEPQALWSQALVRMGDYNGAIAHLIQATKIDPENAEDALALADLYLHQGQFQELKSQLALLQDNPWLTDQQQIKIARLYRQIGDRGSAIRLLESNHDPEPERPDRALLLAQMHAELGEDSQAKAIYLTCLAVEPPSPEVLQAFAEFEASRNLITDARQILNRLDQSSVPPGRKESILGNFESRWGDRSEAIRLFENAVKITPNDARTWQAWAGANLRDDDFTNAFNAAVEGLKHLPGDVQLAALRDRAQALAGLQLGSDAQQLVNFLSINPNDEAALATLNALSSGETDSDTNDHLKAVADQYPQFLAVQTMVINRDFNAGHYESAIERAARVSNLLPIEAEPARLRAMIFAAAHQWQHSLAAAQQWRERSLDHPHPADLAIATAQIGLHQPQLAIEQISWAANGSNDSGVVDVYARALCMENQFDRTWHLMDQTSSGRQHWLRIIADTSPDLTTASQWLDRVATSVSDETDIAQAFFTVARRFDDPASLARALAIVEPMARSASPSPETYLLLSGIQQQKDDLADAEKSVRLALKISPDLPSANNDLAMLMLLRNEDLNAAKQLVMSALQRAPASSALHSTLAEIEQQLNDFEGSKAQFHMAIGLDAENAEAMIGLATLEVRAGEKSVASATVQQAETIIASTHCMLSILAMNQLKALQSG